MAIAHDNSTDGSFGGSGNTLTFSHTCTGSNLILFVAAKAYSGGTISGVTYNGVSMTLVDHQDSTGDLGGHIYLYCLVGPATGAHSVVISGSSNNIAGMAASYSGAKQVQPEASHKQVTDSSSSDTNPVTTITDNDWLVGAWGNQIGVTSAGTGTTQRQTNAAATSIADSGGVINPAGSASLQLTVGSSGNWASVVAAFQPFANAITRSLSDNIMVGASRSTTASRQISLFRSLSDSVMNGASRLAKLGRGFTRTLSDSVMNAANRFATVAYVAHFVQHITANLSDSMMNARGRFANMKAYVNGLLVQFTSRFSPQGTSFSDKYEKQNTTFEDKYQ